MQGGSERPGRLVGASAFRVPAAAAGQGLPGASSSCSPCPQFSTFFPLLRTVCDNTSNSGLGLKAFSFFLFSVSQLEILFSSRSSPSSLFPDSACPPHTCTHLYTPRSQNRHPDPPPTVQQPCDFPATCPLRQGDLPEIALPVRFCHQFGTQLD